MHTNSPTGFSRWPSLFQRGWMRADPGVTTRDHRGTTRVHSHRGHNRNIHIHNHRPHHHGRDQVEPYRPDYGYGNGRYPGYRPTPGVTQPGYRPGGGISDGYFQRMLDSGDIEGLLNSPGAGEWLKKPENNLKVMMAIQNENRLFTLLSNVIKVKHDTAKAAINNVRA